MELNETFIQAFIAAIGSATAIGLIAIIRMVNTVHRDVISLKTGMSEIRLSTDSVFAALRYMLTATRYQNVALKQSGANGCTEQSDEFINKAEEALERRVNERAST